MDHFVYNNNKESKLQNDSKQQKIVITIKLILVEYELSKPQGKLQGWKRHSISKCHCVSELPTPLYKSL